MEISNMERKQACKGDIKCKGKVVLLNGMVGLTEIVMFEKS